MKEVEIKKENLFEHLKERGFVYQTTNEEEVRKLCDNGETTVYVGIDPNGRQPSHWPLFFAFNA